MVALETRQEVLVGISELNWPMKMSLCEVLLRKTWSAWI